MIIYVDCLSMSAGTFIVLEFNFADPCFILLTFQEEIIKFFPTLAEMMKNTEVVAFTCGLLSDPSPLVEVAYTMLISKIVHRSDCSYQPFGREPVLFESLYRESNIPLPGHYFQNQFINFYQQIEFYHRSGSFSKYFTSNPIYRPSRLFFTSLKMELELGTMNNLNDVTDNKIFICSSDPKPKNLLAICCKISQDQPITHLVLKDVLCPNTTEPCAISIRQNNFKIYMFRFPCQHISWLN